MKKQTVPRFSVALAVKNKTPLYDIIATAETTNMILKVFVSEKKLIFLKIHCIVHRCTVYNNYRT